MPYPNEHAARLQEPGKFNPQTFRRTQDGTIYGKIKVPQTVSVIWGKLKKADKPSDNPIPQSLRFPTKNWTSDQAKKWLKDNNVKYISFEPASGSKKSQAELSGQEAMIGARIQTVMAELKSEMWVMEDHALQKLFNVIDAQKTAPPAGVIIEAAERPMKIKGSTAVIPIRGVLMRKIPAAFTFWGIDATSYDTISGQVAEALADNTVKEILLDVDSPGGTVPGVAETAEVIRLAREQKPIRAVIDDLGASGAYWLASQASDITAVKNGMAGSIGVFSVYLDQSARAEELGIKVIVIKSGEHKGMGVPGAAITDEQISAIQEIINGIADNFIADVAAGRLRKKNEVAEWATGKLWLADKAAAIGIIDKVKKTQTKKIISKEKIMDEMTNQQVDAQIAENEKAQARALEDAKSRAVTDERARISQIKNEFADDPDFAMKAAAEGWSLEKALAEYAGVLRKRIKEQNEQQQAAGSTPLSSDDTDEGSGGDFISEARQMAEEKGISKTEAMRRLARTKPQMYQSFLNKCETEGRRMYAEAV